MPLPDVVIRGARILDGSGGPERNGDIVVAGDRIVDVASVVDRAAGAEVVDASGLAVMPGIVDLHTHSDISTMSEPSSISAVGMGVTTQVVGHCGFSAAPVSAETIADMLDEEPIAAFPGVDWAWRSFAEYLAAVDHIRPATNIVSLVGHSTVRRFVMGSEDRPPTAPELLSMQDALGDCFRDGARGFSTGLTYAPGLFADDAEIVALAAVAGRAGLPYHTHMRYEWAGGVRGSVIESIDHATRAGVELNISHLYPRPDEAIDEVERYFELMDLARARGTSVKFDVTVFPRGGGAWLQVVPKWARDGGLAATVERIRDPATRARLTAELREGTAWVADPDDQLVVKISRPENAGLVGRTVGAIARERGQDALDTALDLIVEDGQFWIAPTIKNQAHLDRLISHPLSVPVSDGMAQHPVRHRDLGIMPKTFGTFPHVLGSYVRERGALTLPDAVRRMTREAADRVGLSDRGRLEPGAIADLVVFDPDTVANRATEEGDPGAAPAGISRVMVNGRWALIDGAHATEGFGRAL